MNTQSREKGAIRWGWLKGMYIYTILAAGGMGLGILIMPDTMRRVFSWPAQDPIVLGLAGSIYLAAAVLALMGLRSPLRFSALLLFELVYKTIWLIGVILPMVIQAKFPAYAIPQVIIFATFIIGNMIAIPFSYLFAKHAEPSAKTAPAWNDAAE